MRTCRQPDISPGIFFGLAAAMLLLPLRWLLALIFAALVHEACHVLAVRLCGGQIGHIRFGAGGAVIQAFSLSPGKALFCTLAGPLGSLLLLPLARWFPRLAICAAVQSIYNLLPVQGLDGSHAFRYLAAVFLPPRAAESLCRITERLLLAALAFLGFYGTFILKLGVLPILIAGCLVIKGTSGKIPCKSGPMRVQ